jgi:hypothetical protein
VETSLDTHSLALAMAGLAVGFVVFCLVDVVRAEKVRYLPKWAWAILCLGIGLTIPFGGILYLAIGKDRSPSHRLCRAEADGSHFRRALRVEIRGRPAGPMP